MNDVELAAATARKRLPTARGTSGGIRTFGSRHDLRTAERRELARLIATSPRPPRPGMAAVPRRAGRPNAGLDITERAQLAAVGAIERYEAPSGNPLSILEPKTRAIATLLLLGEEPGLVGREILGAPGRTAASRARATLIRARHAIASAALQTTARRRPRLLRLIPQHRRRWVLLLRASGAFDVDDAVNEMASVLGVDRATCYRDLARATAALNDYATRREARA